MLLLFAFFALPALLSLYYIDTMTQVAVYSMVSLALGLLVGRVASSGADVTGHGGAVLDGLQGALPGGAVEVHGEDAGAALERHLNDIQGLLEMVLDGTLTPDDKDGAIAIAREMLASQET